MGKKDIQTADFFEDNRLFADLVNGALFGGSQVLAPEKLKEADGEVRLVHGAGAKKNIRDNVKKYFGNTLFTIYVLEHQQHVDYHMVIRNMLTEAMEYNRQWKQMQREHKEAGDLSPGDEFISGMKREEKFVPVVTLVIYYGENKWDAATSLHELLDFDGEEQLKKYVEDYHIHVFDYHNYENFEMFQTELNQVFSFLKCSFDKKTLSDLIAKRKEEYYNISDEAFELIRTLTNAGELLELEKYRNEERGGNDMCKALEQIRQEGIEEGIWDTLVKLVQKGLLTVKDAAEQAGMSVEEFHQNMSV